MNGTDKVLPVIYEDAFLNLLSSGGQVQVSIRPFGRYYVPFVYYTRSATSERVPYGVIVRQQDMLAAETPRELLNVLFDIAGPDAAMCIEQVGTSEENLDPRSHVSVMH
jgi:hypothetical protein